MPGGGTGVICEWCDGELICSEFGCGPGGGVEKPWIEQGLIWLPCLCGSESPYRLFVRVLFPANPCEGVGANQEPPYKVETKIVPISRAEAFQRVIADHAAVRTDIKAIREAVEALQQGRPMAQ